MLTILLVDAELELIPDNMLDDYSIRTHSKKRKKAPGKIILDSNYMHTAIERYFPGESNRRGRPDIIYHFLMVAMESMLNKQGKLRVWIHTRNNRIIEISPDVRLPKSYNRFIGLFEDLFERHEVRAGDKTLLKVHDGDANALLRLSGSTNVKVLSPTGKRIHAQEMFEDSNEEQSIIMGGFSEGDYISGVYGLGESFSIYGEELTIWSVAMEMIAQYERDFDII